MGVGPILTALYHGNSRSHTKSVCILYKDNFIRKNKRSTLKKNRTTLFFLHMWASCFFHVLPINQKKKKKKSAFYRWSTIEHSYQIEFQLDFWFQRRRLKQITLFFTPLGTLFLWCAFDQQIFFIEKTIQWTFLLSLVPIGSVVSHEKIKM